MNYCDRSRVVVSAHNGVVTKCYCLPLRQRSLFLEHWEDAWEIIKESVLAQSAAQHDKVHAIAYLWDEGNRDGADDRCKYFVWLCKEMLRLHGVNGLQGILGNLFPLVGKFAPSRIGVFNKVCP